eukprot:TRINITY_DN14560_c0_g2_i1.p1 TRINITY_DN14560_c0_g2~~TRINITY_DN14560_c0_g2_i1.p1  ORF type:complete len:152 (+),score=15.30 TRINITY_DN14560_c0_g2_i1:30-458(+)
MLEPRMMTQLFDSLHSFKIKILFALVFISDLVKQCEAVEKINITETATKSYEDEEEGKILPHRTFLETWEIVVICVVCVVFVFLIVLPVVYVCLFGWVLPKCCRRKRNEFTHEQQYRERKIGEIWKHQYTQQQYTQVHQQYN